MKFYPLYVHVGAIANNFLFDFSNLLGIIFRIFHQADIFVDSIQKNSTGPNNCFVLALSNVELTGFFDYDLW